MSKDDLKAAYERFRGTPVFHERSEQITRFRPVAQAVLQALLAKPSISNEDLTGLIHLFRPKPIGALASKYLAHIVADKAERDQLTARFQNLKVGGYTAPGRLRIHDLTTEQLAIVHQFLGDAMTIGNAKDGAMLCETYDSKKVTYVTAGIYSPWLHYMQPEVFPILNNATKGFFRQRGIPVEYPALVRAMPTMQAAMGENDLGLLDSMAWHEQNHGPEGTLEEHSDPKDGSWHDAKWIKKITRADWEHFLASCDRVIKEFKIAPDDRRLVLNPRLDGAQRLSFSLRNRLVLGLEHKRDTQVILLLPPDQHDQMPDLELKDRDFFNTSPPAALYHLPYDEFRAHDEELLGLVIGRCRLHTPHGDNSTYRIHHVPDIYRMVTEVDFRQKALDYLLDGTGLWPGSSSTNQMEQKRRYWAAGFGSDNGNAELASFKAGNFWQALRYSDDDDSSTANEARRLFTEIAPNDLFLIKGYGGQHDLKVHYVGRVKSIDRGNKRVDLSPLDAPLFNGKAPRGPGAGNWHNTLLEVTRPEDIGLLFSAAALTDSSKAMFRHDHNRILYGPPGTGKTYSTASYSVAIVEGIDPEVVLTECATQAGREAVLERFRSYRQDGRIAIVTFHQSYSYEDFVEGIKPVLGSEDGQVRYELKDGLFKRICDSARDNWISVGNQAKGLAPFDEAFERLVEKWEEDRGMKFPMQTEGYEFTITGFSESSISFRKASGGEQHTLSKGTLQDIYYGRREMKPSGVGIYYPGVIRKLLEFTPTQQGQVKSKQFVLVIDEINRGNVSGIFGELITLLETDKRLGALEELHVRLPYSKDRDFSVPSNLYLLGTMNTADRSVEALDTALRRRFSFVEMPSRPDLVQQPDGFAVELEPLLAAINGRIERLLDRDHHIGHSYFMDIHKAADPEHELRLVFKNKVIPLLQEYFYGDPRKLGAVLGPRWVQKRDAAAHKLFGKFDIDDAGKDVFDIADPMNVGLEAFAELYA